MNALPFLRIVIAATMTPGYRAVGDETTGSYTHGPSNTPFVPHPLPLFPPGAAYAYWDSAMSQFGHVLTHVAGEPLDQLFKRRVADPIGMNPAAWKWGDYKLYVIPSWRLVIVRLGLDQSDRAWAATDQGEFLRLVGEARTGASAR